MSNKSHRNLIISQSPTNKNSIKPRYNILNQQQQYQQKTPSQKKNMNKTFSHKFTSPSNTNHNINTSHTDNHNNSNNLQQETYFKTQSQAHLPTIEQQSQDNVFYRPESQSQQNLSQRHSYGITNYSYNTTNNYNFQKQAISTQKIQFCKILLQEQVQKYLENQKSSQKQNQSEQFTLINDLSEQIQIILQYTQDLEEEIRILKKEHQLKDKMNEFLQMSLQKKDQFLQANGEEMIKLKNNLDSITNKYLKLQKKQQDNEHKNSNNIILKNLNINANSNSNKNLSVKSGQNLDKNNGNQQLLSQIKHKSTSNLNLKQIKESNSPNSIINQNVKQQNVGKTPISNKSNKYGTPLNKEGDSTKNKKNIVIPQFTVVQNQSNNSGPTPKSNKSNKQKANSPNKGQEKKQLTLSFFRRIIDQNEKVEKQNLKKLAFNKNKEGQFVSKQAEERFQFIQHATEFKNYSLLLDMKREPEMLRDQFFNHRCFRIVNNNFHDEQYFIDAMKKAEKDDIGNIIESVNYVFSSLQMSINVILKLKQIMWGVAHMHSSLVLTEAFENIVNQTCEILGCDRASVYLIDSKRQELWTKVAKGTSTIRIPYGKGFAGEVVQSGKVVNVLDAQQDKRFDQFFDKKNNYRTKSVLCCPIIDEEHNQILGVLQAINKSENSELSFFTKDDEGLIQILAQLGSAVLRNSLYHDQRLAYHNSLKLLLKAGQKMASTKSFQELITVAENVLMTNFDTNMARIFIYDQQVKKLFRYDNDNGQKIEVNTDIGIIGKCFNSWQIELVSNCQNHISYNSITDLQTLQPVISIPISADDSIKQLLGQNQKEKLGVIQIINPRGIENLLYNGVKNFQTNQVFNESIQTFTQILSANIGNFFHQQNLLEKSRNFNENKIQLSGNNQ